MAVIGSWNGFQFVVSPSVIRGFTGLTIKGGTETEDKVSEKQKYVERLNSAVTEVSLTVSLNAFLGCDVRGEAESMIGTAMKGDKGYFYVGSKKLVPYQLMLISAEVTEMEIAANGTWISCKINLVMKQCEKWEALSSGSSGSSGASGSTTTNAKKDTVIASTYAYVPTAGVGTSAKAEALSLAQKQADALVGGRPPATTATKTTTTQTYTAQKAAAAIAYQKAVAAKNAAAGVVTNGKKKIAMVALKE